MFRIAVCSLLVLGSVQAAAQEVNPADPEGVVTALQDLGYRASLETDGVGDPMIRTATSGVEYNIYFYGCTNNSDCEDMRFLAGLDLKQGIDDETIRAWNESSLIGTAYVDDEQDPFLGFYVVTTGGVSKETFEEAVDLWSRSLGRFLEHTGFNQ
ncbi:MAG: YbjN domain-containing protein [Pseudomonadota bacterium]